MPREVVLTPEGYEKLKTEIDYLRTDKLRTATVIDEKSIDKDVVSVGSLVRVKDQKSGRSIQYQIVGSAEADPSENRLSNESPVGQALLGHKRGEVVTVQVPRGPNRKLKI